MFDRKPEFDFMTEHPDYIRRKSQWKMVRDCVEGSDAIKAMGEAYLPKAVGMSDKRYESYSGRAVFVNYVAQTLDGTHGMIFRRKPVLTYPPELEDFVTNVDGRGNDLYQFASDTVFDVMQTTFGGYLVDYPPAPSNANLSDAEKKGIKPYITYYSAENIINWKFAIVNGVSVPVLIVLKEACDGGSEFTHVVTYRYRALRLIDGVYSQTLFSVINDKEGKASFTKTDIPVKVNHRPLDFIPFVFAPCDSPEKPMLKDIADVNIGHYRKSADHENGIHLTTIPTGYILGEEPQVDEQKNIQPIYLGADNFLIFPNENAKIGTLCYAGEGLTHVEKALESAELQMVVLGSRIITPEKGISETAESANIHRAGENAKLATFANNMSECFSMLLNIVCRFKGLESKCKVHFNTDYETQGFDANALNAMANIYSQGKLPLIALYGMMMKGEFFDADMTYDEYVELLDYESAGLSPKEVNETYKQWKETHRHPTVKAKKLPTNEEVEKKTEEVTE